MAKLKSQSKTYIEIKEAAYLQFVENTMLIEALKIAGIEKMPIWKAIQHILQHQQVDILIHPVTRKYS